jgi:hypothetical protein
VVVSFKLDRVIVAADSRAMTDGGSHRDDDCKILVFGKDIIFASSGLAHTELVRPYAAVWDAKVAAKESVAELSHDKNATARGIADALASSWEKAAAIYFEPIVKEGGEKAFSVVPALQRGQIVEAVFIVRTLDDAIAVTHAVVLLDRTTYPSTIVSSSSPIGIKPGWAVMGNSNVFINYIPQPKNASAQLQVQGWLKSVANLSVDEQQLSQVGQLVQWTIDAGIPDIGGDVDELVMLRATGARWVHRKSVCPADSRQN